jgi:hypothetical protein
VHIPLRERNRNPFGVESQLDLAGDLPVDLPVVVGLCPGPNDKIDRGISEIVQPDVRRRLVEDEFVRVDERRAAWRKGIARLGSGCYTRL